MSRFIKEKIVEQYGRCFREVSAVAVINTQGVGVVRLTAFRDVLRQSGIRAMRVHNRLGRRAALASGTLVGIETLLDGPSTIVWGGENIVDIAKILQSQAGTLAELEIRGGMSDGEVLSKEQMAALSELPSREELIGWLVGNAVGQAARVAAAAMAVAGRLLAQIREVQEQAPADETPTGEQATVGEAAPAQDPAPNQPEPDQTPQEDVAEEAEPDETAKTGGAQEPPAPEPAPPDQ